MTPEEKARAYDEAIKKATALYKVSEPMSGCNVIIETLFPELTESEDEKIRKTLIQLFQSDNEESFGEFTNKQFVSWLERQAEKKPVWSEEKPQLKEGKYYKCIKSYHYLGYGEYVFEEGKVYFCEKDGYLRSDPNNLIKVYDCKNWQSYFQPQSNSEWSKEDERRSKDIVYFLDTTKKHYACTEELDACIDWIQSLKSKVQPKQEWSEEDEKMIRGLLAICDEWAVRHSFYPKENSDIEKLKNWLKSLRPQNNWKPSDHELEVLRLVAEKDGTCLMGLYEQLKKLKDEQV